MDTVMELQLWGADAQQGVDMVEQLLFRLEETWSATREDSLLSRMNRGELEKLDEEEQNLLDRVLRLRQRTQGAFDPQLFCVSQAWGFYDQQYRVPSGHELGKALKIKQWDLGGVLKGYAGMLAAEYLADMQVSRALLNLGGNIQTFGQKADGTPWNIGIQNPDGGDPVGAVRVSGTVAVVTSGVYQRFFEQAGVRYHHILDPQTGIPAQTGLKSVTVISQDGMVADALSTGLLVMGMEKAVDLWRQSDDFEAVFILETGAVFATEGANFSGGVHEVIKK